MTIDQAHKLLDQVMANLQLTRQDHVALQSALGILYSKAKDYEESNNGGTNKQSGC